MTDTLATEVTNPLTTSTGEQWHSNERMRHIPRLHWMADKLEGDLRMRIERACHAIESAPPDDPRRVDAGDIERSLCRALERLAEVAKHNRGPLHPPNDLSRHVTWSVQHAVASVRSADDDLIGRRFPFHTFERSKAEPLYGALLAVIDATHHLVDAARFIDPNIDAALLEGLVQLNAPMRTEPIA
ncbi:MAG TPA: hypothetical protein VH087_16305 [Thermoanaerobaculia bacterium]|nr:hypothetical protein [Thermoanaerobaculia bacterium]